MREKSRIVPPADHFAGSLAIIWGPVRDRGIRNCEIGPRGKLEKGRIEWQNGLAFCAGAFRKNDHAFSGVEPFDYLFTGSWDVAPILPVDKDIAHILYYSSGQEPISYLCFRDKYTCDHGPQGCNVGVAKMIGDEKE